MITTILITEGWMTAMTIEYVINKDNDEQFTLRLLNDKGCEIILEYVRELATVEAEVWTNIHNNYIMYDSEPFGANKGNFKYLGTFKASNKIIDYYMYLIQKRIDDINKLEECLILQYKGVN